MKRVVVLGAGYAGILTAKKLAKQVKKANLGDVEITIVDKNPFHTMLTELHEVAAQRVEEDSIRINLKRVFAGRNVNVAHEKVTGIDYENRVITHESGTRSYDYLVLASGSKPAFFGVPGAKDNSFTLWSYEDAIRLREHIETMFRTAAMEPDIAKKREMLTFFVVGAGFTGVEMAGELAEFAPILCDRYEIDPSLVTMCDVDMLERACMVLPEKLAAKVKSRLEKMNVKVMFKTNIKGVGEDYIEYESGGKTTQVKTNTVIWTAGVEGTDIAFSSGEALGAAGRGRIQTDEYLRSVKHPNVYVAGDNIFYIPEGEKQPVPQMVENAEASAHTVSHNLAADLAGKGEKEKYKPSFHGVMVCIGGRWGTAHGGLPGKFFGMPSFFAMFAKHFINVVYFIQVLGWNKIFSYIKHEFFTVRNKRSFLGGHFSNRGPSFFGVPLRIWLGVYWVYEAALKVGEGWFSNLMLDGFYNGTNAWYDSILGRVAADAVTAASGAADAVASASGAAVAAAAPTTIYMDWQVLGIFNPVLINDGSIAAKLGITPIDWLLNSIIIPSEGLQMFMQIAIVLMEFGVGLALIGGLFTSVAGVVSLVLQFMFLTTTGIYMESFWMLFASVAVMFGAGQVFSLDYYVGPWLKKWWKGVGFAKKWYLYND